MKQKYFISVIIPVYNTQQYIGRCLRSLRNQSISKRFFEIIIVDDFSTDNSLKEIKKQKNSNKKIIKNKKNLGLPASLNIGLKAARWSFVELTRMTGSKKIF